MRVTHILLAAFFTIAAVHSAPSAEPAAAERLHEIFGDAWDRNMREFPTWASSLGDMRYNDRWRDLSSTALADWRESQRTLLERLTKIETRELSPADRVNYRLFQRELETNLEGFRYRRYLVPLNQREGIQDASSTADSLRFKTAKDYEDWLARLRAFPAYMDQTLALMQKGIDVGMLHPRVVMRRVPAQIKKQIVDDPEKSLFYKPFRRLPDDIPADDRGRLAAKARQVIASGVIPAYRKMLTFFEEKYLPACYEKVGAWQLPQGREFYAYRCRKYTTTNLTPKEIHQIGQREVKRIRGEMEAIVRKVKWKGTFAEFLEDLRTNPKFYYDDPNELLAGYKQVCKQVDPKLPRIFRKLPKIPYGIEAIPQNMAPDTTAAYYRLPSADGRRPGTYFVNLYKPESRPKYEMEALSLHEAVPGHHLQIALAMELENLPNFRRYGGYTAFVEGWALYSERLGEELGLYRDPYSKFGQLTYEMWRAVRLVVDTGMHAFQWTRQDAIDFFTLHTAKTELDIVNEVDRYIAWPGQALAYKIGELKITELRRTAERKLGNRFDLREFHDVVLRDGAVTLDVLEDNVNRWLRSFKK